jgi:hypothetical protein
MKQKINVPLNHLTAFITPAIIHQFSHNLLNTVSDQKTTHHWNETFQMDAKMTECYIHLINLNNLIYRTLNYCHGAQVSTLSIDTKRI